jgi:superfamily II DNA/RNA helicase
VLEILSRIKGERLPGLKETVGYDISSSSSTSASSNNNKKHHNLTQKWSQQNLILSKKVSKPEELRYLMASATLTNSVKQLAWPIMRSYNSQIGFCVVDGDTGATSTIRFEDDLYYIKPDQQGEKALKALKDQKIGDNDDEGEDSDDEEDSSDDEKEDSHKQDAASSKEKPTKDVRMTLSKDDLIDTPTRLSQYSMIIPCKWKLSALLSFLYLRKNKKVIVFFSTCDSVDYHGLLFREMKWPSDGFDSNTFNPLNAGSENTSNDGKKNNSYFSSMEDMTSIDWKEHEQQLDKNEFASSVPSSSSASKTKGKNGKFDKNAKKDGSSSSSSATTPSSSTFTTIDPLNWKFTGIFGESCPIFRLHGKVPQSIRKLVYKEFAKVSTGILLCTDVAARGLDLPKVDYIVQYDPPCETSDYIHRIGRTARCGLAGNAVLFLLPSEQIYLNLLSSYGMTLSSLSLTSMLSEISKDIPGITPKRFKNYEEIASVVIQKATEACVVKNKYLTGAGIQAYHSYLRSYTTHSNDTKGIFRLQLLHLGHLAKAFGLKETPKEFKSSHKGIVNSNDIIGKIFNGEFSSKAFKTSLLPPSSSSSSSMTVTNTEAKKKDEKKNKNNNKKKAVEEAESGDEDVVSVDNDAEEEEEEVDVVPEAIEQDNEGEMFDEDMDIENNDDLVSLEREDDDENVDDVDDEDVPGSISKKRSLRAHTNDEGNNMKKKAKVSKSSSKVSSSSSVSTVPSGTEYGLGKRKLSFGSKTVRNGNNKLSPSGKFRKGGSYFRKKLRNQLSSEFKAN